MSVRHKLGEGREPAIVTEVTRLLPTCPRCRLRGVDTDEGRREEPGSSLKCGSCGAAFESFAALLQQQDAACICATDLPDCGPALYRDELIDRPICRRCYEEE